MIYLTLEDALMAIAVELKPQQQEQYDFYESQVAAYGQYSQGIGANGSHYGAQSPFTEEGIVCANCVYYTGGACEIVEGSIAPQGICKFWIIPEAKLTGV